MSFIDTFLIYLRGHLFFYYEKQFLCFQIANQNIRMSYYRHSSIFDQYRSHDKATIRSLRPKLHRVRLSIINSHNRFGNYEWNNCGNYTRLILKQLIILGPFLGFSWKRLPRLCLGFDPAKRLRLQLHQPSHICIDNCWLSLEIINAIICRPSPAYTNIMHRVFVPLPVITGCWNLSWNTNTNWPNYQTGNARTVFDASCPPQTMRAFN